MVTKKEDVLVGAVMYQFIFYFLALAFNGLHELTKIILKMFAESK